MLAFIISSNTCCFIVVFTICYNVIEVQNCDTKDLLLRLGKHVQNGDKTELQLQGNTPPDTPRRRGRCCPYDFDSKFCRVVDDRLLCGFNKNVGTPISNNDFVKLTGDCRIRGERLECGYEEPPFKNSRRPPVRDDIEPSGEYPIEQSIEYPSEKVESVSKLKRLDLKKVVTTAIPKRVTRCIETADNRIVCRHV